MNPRVHAVLAFLLVSGCAVAQPVQDAMVTNVDVFANKFDLRSDRVLWEYTFSDLKTLYFRVQFEQVQLSTPGLQIVIRDGLDRELTRFGAKDLAGQKALLTGSLYANKIKIQLVGDAAPAEAPFRITKVIHQRDPRGSLEPQSIVPKWLTYPAQVGRRSTELQAVADSVAKVNAGDGWSCSAFVVGPRTMLTNYHCLKLSTRFKTDTPPDKAECGDLEAIFDFNQPIPNPNPDRSPRCTRVADYDEALDFALLVFDAIPTLSGGKPRTPVKLAEREPRDAEVVFLVHHPSGLPKQVSLNCKLSTLAGAEFEHDCDTAGGSSGAPVLTADGALGLHFRGAYPEDMTVKQIEAAIARGVVFRNRAKLMKEVAARIRSKIE